MEYEFFAAAGEEKLEQDHSDGIHFFDDLSWSEFVGVLHRPHDWLCERVEPSRRGRIEEELDLLVSPSQHGFFVEYSEDARIVSVGIAKHSHSDKEVDTVTGIIFDNVVRAKRSHVIREVHARQGKIVSLHVELGCLDGTSRGDGAIWQKIASVVLQSYDLLIREMLRSSRSKKFDRVAMNVRDQEVQPIDLPRPGENTAYSFLVQLTPTCSEGESEEACLQNYPGWRRVPPIGPGGVKKYCRP